MLRYGLAVTLVALTVFIKLLLDPLIGIDTPFLLLLLPVIVSAWYGGLGAGLLATVLAAVASAYFFLPPLYTMRVGVDGELRVGAFAFEGAFISILSAARDRAKLALRTAKERAFEILESITDGFVSFSPDFDFTYVNSAAELLLRSSKTDLLGRNLWQVYPAALGGPLEEGFRRAMTERVPMHLEYYSEQWESLVRRARVSRPGRRPVRLSP